jgi:hypothetical protein
MLLEHDRRLPFSFDHPDRGADTLDIEASIDDRVIKSRQEFYRRDNLTALTPNGLRLSGARSGAVMRLEVTPGHWRQRAP